MKKFYTYYIGWTEHDIYYYGVRTGNRHQPDDDFWKFYFTSSPTVKTLREKFGEPDLRQIRKRFRTRLEAKLWERRVLRYIGTKHPKYINGKGPDFYT